MGLYLCDVAHFIQELGQRVNCASSLRGVAVDWSVNDIVSRRKHDYNLTLFLLLPIAMLYSA